MPEAKARNSDGFSQRDYALRNTAWHVTNVLRDLRREVDECKEGFFDLFSCHEEGGPEPYPFVDAAQATIPVRNSRRVRESTRRIPAGCRRGL
jgi:hypothetical protein